VIFYLNFFSHDAHEKKRGGALWKKIVILLVHVKIYARGGLVLAICKAQFEGGGLWMLMAFKLGVPQGRYPFSLRENFMLRNDQASSTRLTSTHNYWTINQFWSFQMGEKKNAEYFKRLFTFFHNFFFNWEKYYLKISTFSKWYNFMSKLPAEVIW
jgi:hypothetical protein